jgi:hypothetical protein
MHVVDPILLLSREQAVPQVSTVPLVF